MEFKVGEIVEGKVKSITNFGAFISLPEGKTGMVHISEIAHAYVSDIRQHLTEGQDVKVMVLAAEPNGRINLSIKRTVAPPERPAQRRGGFDRRGGERGDRPGGAPQGRSGGFQSRGDRPQHQERRAEPQFSRSYTPAPSKDQSFEDKLKQFMSESDSKLSSVRQYSDHKTKTRRR